MDCCDLVYYFGEGFLLTVWSQGRATQPAGTEDTGWLQHDTEATRSGRVREGDGGVRRKTRFVVSLRLPSTSSSLLYFNFSPLCLTKLELCSSIHPSVPPFSLPPLSALSRARSLSQTDTATLLDVSFLLACPNKGAQSCET